MIIYEIGIRISQKINMGINKNVINILNELTDQKGTNSERVKDMNK